MKSKILTLVALTFLLISCKGQNKETASESTVINETIDAKSFAEKLQSAQNPQIIDVRTPEEFNSKHLENAINIDINNPNFATEIAKLDTSKPTFVYCLSGGRSATALAKMKELGFKEAYNMKGGMMKWNALGLGNSKPSPAGMTKADFDKLLETDKKVLIDFYAEWCGPCKKMEPFLNKMTEELKDKVTIIRIDVDKNETLANELKVEFLPTLMVYENKKVTWQGEGYVSEEELRKKL
ncbi:thioredoxin domain-containing protein [Flavobacterium sp.]|uniref:thioredoxin domain-containing protein n=1 Tax=Flavobacterium sp. TaxID=239 RepID=UPI002B4AB00B|nr:thioredoxin domain-containing protein [Flavobacterium sp.]HLP64409.1 thioredoxin domain-containing protein [Flavobacterium sp.]